VGGRGASSGLAGSQSVLKNIENKICRDTVETAYLVDTNGNIIFSKSDNMNSCVSFSYEQLKMFEGNIITHNHPSGTTFSYEDVSLLTCHKCKEIRAATSSGTFSLMVYKNSKNYKEGNLDFAIAYKISMELNITVTDIEYEKMQRDYDSGQISREDFQNGCDLLNNQLSDIRNQWLEENAHKYGYIYKFQKWR
jgi:hypothetical protein